MDYFSLSETPVAIRDMAVPPHSGAIVEFEGRVRNHNEGKEVVSLEYSAYPALAVKEGNRIVREAIKRFSLDAAICTHRVGSLTVGDVAVIVRVCSGHRGEAFEACRWIIDEVKSRVPIWKKERYTDGTGAWVLCEHGSPESGHHDHGHTSHETSGAGSDGGRVK